MSFPAILALEDGSIFYGEGFGEEKIDVGELVFNTSMTGYQEIITDPSYKKQIITFTHPHIGNTGINDEDNESSLIHASGLVINKHCAKPSNWRSSKTLDKFLREQEVIAISEINTRKLTSILRDKGSLNSCIAPLSKLTAEEAIAKAKDFSGLKGMDLAKVVSTKEQYLWTEGSWQLGEGHITPENNEFHVVAYDFGAKRNILRMLVERGCKVTVVPAQTPASAVLAMNPDGVFLSNGPGDPEPCTYAIEAVQTFLEKELPIFGICLGHQILALACGAKTVKMKFGHHGANHPVQEMTGGLVMITSQNHGFAVDKESLPETLRATHFSLFDDSLQGLHHTSKPAFSFQGHPEASPGPQDAAPLFDHFIDLLEQSTGK